MCTFILYSLFVKGFSLVVDFERNLTHQSSSERFTTSNSTLDFLLLFGPNIPLFLSPPLRVRYVSPVIHVSKTAFSSRPCRSPYLLPSSVPPFRTTPLRPLHASPVLCVGEPPVPFLRLEIRSTLPFRDSLPKSVPVSSRLHIQFQCYRRPTSCMAYFRDHPCHPDLPTSPSRVYSLLPSDLGTWYRLLSLPLPPPASLPLSLRLSVPLCVSVSLRLSKL